MPRVQKLLNILQACREVGINNIPLRFNIDSHQFANILIESANFSDDFDFFFIEDLRSVQQDFSDEQLACVANWNSLIYILEYSGDQINDISKRILNSNEKLYIVDYWASGADDVMDWLLDSNYISDEESYDCSLKKFKDTFSLLIYSTKKFYREIL